MTKPLLIVILLFVSGLKNADAATCDAEAAEVIAEAYVLALFYPDPFRTHIEARQSALSSPPVRICLEAIVEALLTGAPVAPPEHAVRRTAQIIATREGLPQLADAIARNINETSLILVGTQLGQLGDVLDGNLAYEDSFLYASAIQYRQSARALRAVKPHSFDETFWDRYLTALSKLTRAWMEEAISNLVSLEAPPEVRMQREAPPEAGEGGAMAAPPPPAVPPEAPIIATGRHFMVGCNEPGSRENAYGLYSYILLRHPPSEDEIPQLIAFFDSFLIKLLPVQALEEKSIPRKNLNVTSVPVIETPPNADIRVPAERLRLAKWLVRNYDHACAQRLLAALPSRANFHLVSVLEPLTSTDDQPELVFIQRIDWAYQAIAGRWLEFFMEEVSGRNHWSQRALFRLALHMRVGIIQLAEATPEVARGFSSMRELVNRVNASVYVEDLTSG